MMYEEYFSYEQRIYRFAKKWLERFCDANADEMEFTEHYMAEDCKKLEFVMDSGKSFEKKYGDAASSYEELKKIINQVDNIALIGSAIYSRWRYYNHWAMGSESILEFKNRAWFIAMLNRLVELTEDNLFGELQKVKIVSNALSYGPKPEDDEEIEQSLTIRADGRVWFYGYNYDVYSKREYYNENRGKIKESRKKYFRIEPKKAQTILKLISKYFTLNNNQDLMVTDVGRWNLYITNTEGEKTDFGGCLYGELVVDGIGLSNFIREALGMDDLFLFGACWDYNKINKIEVEYNRESQIKPKIYTPNLLSEYIIEARSEKLMIDRKTGVIEYIQNISPSSQVIYRNENKKEVLEFLNSYYAEGLFSEIYGEPDDAVERICESVSYKLTVDYTQNPQYVMEGSYDKNNLPYGWGDFIEDLSKLMNSCDTGEIFNPAYYNRENRSIGEYIFCSVTFERGGRSYYYLTEDDSIKVGDFVVVLVGYERRKEVVKVVKIEYFSEDKAPYPVQNTKRIIEKYRK